MIRWRRIDLSMENTMSEKCWVSLNPTWKHANVSHDQAQFAQLSLLLNKWGIKPGEVVLGSVFQEKIDYSAPFPMGTVVSHFPCLIFTDLDQKMLHDDIKARTW